MGQFVLGLAFGFLFRIWARIPNSLETHLGPSIHAFHLRWGLVLLVLFITGISAAPISRILPHLDAINTPLVSLNFKKIDSKFKEINTPGDQPPRDKSHARAQFSSSISRSFLSSIGKYMNRDKEYIEVLHRHITDKNIYEKLISKHDAISRGLRSTAQCLTDRLLGKAGYDSASINLSIGLSLAESVNIFRSMTKISGMGKGIPRAGKKGERIYLKNVKGQSNSEKRYGNCHIGRCLLRICSIPRDEGARRWSCWLHGLIGVRKKQRDRQLKIMEIRGQLWSLIGTGYGLLFIYLPGPRNRGQYSGVLYPWKNDERDGDIIFNK